MSEQRKSGASGQFDLCSMLVAAKLGEGGAGLVADREIPERTDRTLAGFVNVEGSPKARMSAIPHRATSHRTMRLAGHSS